MNILLWIDTAVIVGLVFLPEILHANRQSSLALWLDLANLILIFSLRALMFRGKITLASELLVLLIFAHVTIILVDLGTTRLPAMSAYILIVVCAGVLLNWRALVSTMLLAIAAGTALMAGEISGLMTSTLGAGLTLVDWAVYVVLILYAAGFIFITQQELRGLISSLNKEAQVRKRAEEDLRRSSNFFVSIFNGLDDPILVKDENLLWVMANDSACRLLGLPRDQIIGKSDSELYSPDQAVVFLKQDRQVLDEGIITIFEQPVTVKNEQRVFLVRKSRFFDPVTGEKYVCVASHDITERKRSEENLARARDYLERQVAARVAELNAANRSLQKEINERQQADEALHRSMEELLTFMDVTPGVVFLISEDGVFKRWNAKLLEAVGMTGEQLQAINAADLVYVDDRPLIEEAVKKALEEGSADAEVRIINGEGQAALFYIAGARLVGEDGARYFAGVGVDITSLFVTEAALRESEERFRSLVESIPDIVLVSDFSGRMLYTTPSLERQTGLTLPDLQGEAEEMHAPLSDDSGGLQQAIQEFVQNDQAFSTMIENRLVGKDNQMHWYSSILSRVQYRGEPALQVVSRDITEQKRAEEALSRSRMRLRALLDATPDSTFLIAADGTFLAVNEATARNFGMEVEDLVGKNGLNSLLDEISAGRSDRMRQVLQNGKPVRFEDYGLSGWSDNSMYPVFSPDGKVEAVAMFSRDITEQKLSEEALRESEERYALAARGANDCLWDLNLRTSVIYLSPRWKSIIGLPEEESRIPMAEWLDSVHPDDRDHLTSRLDVHLKGGILHFECEFRSLHTDGTYRWIHIRGLAVRDDSGKAYRAAGSMTDISENKRISDQLLYDALHDSLTGLPNRGLLTDRIEQAIERRKRYHDFRYAVLYLDLDGFKDINDTYTHNIGDQLLIAAAQRMKVCLRAADTLARLGGDEFVVLQTGVTGQEDAISLAVRLQEELGRAFNLDGTELSHTSASIGIVLGEDTHSSPDDILRDADIAMYQAKYKGKACYQVFDTSMRNQVQARVRLESDLRQAIEYGELEVFYHPIISLHTGRFTGFEALARWRHPTRGLILPGEFIPLAENNLMIIPLDRWVLREACRQMKEWQEWAGVPMTISVNLSGRHFPHADLVEAIQSILEETGLNHSDLVVEITESAFMENIELATVTLKGLKLIGVGVEFDDFGKGYSSLNYLREMPVDTLKIDSSFIRQIANDHREEEVVNAIVQLGHILNLNVVAEGVETPEQLELLKQMNCDFAQGYLFAHPLDSESAAKWIGENCRVSLT